ncbi:ribosomal RNA large subunit methyltransferase J [Fonticula alba]|uniref:Ribosomal RNA large subunit methyltransferase J n=1 Tax=Fonticula alba TaxID=691883 RepID=A0A058ZGS9_FONAL|nr:ribosomal RNA large subunit methyltransferase J [Fonticula alba]KCV72697.1 ribosomal RNA large subunit methyltransferase J [Fonticula alba]|eukprot:XP_009492398.1 ribosomal RNA large subunit methyltransferase J [Fonticula alba]
MKGRFTLDSRDHFYRQAKAERWRARSAFKLLQIAEHYRIFDGVTRAVDLCAAPGSWSQVLRRELCSDAAIVSIDLQPIAPLKGVHLIQADITHPDTIRQVHEALSRPTDPTQAAPMDEDSGPTVADKGLADLVVCDGAPDVTGVHSVDEWLQAQLLTAALTIVSQILRPGGAFTAKFFLEDNTSFLFAQMQAAFGRVSIFKPASSRPSSREHFIVCQDFLAPKGLAESLAEWTAAGAIPRPTGPAIAPYVATGDLAGFNAEATPDTESDSFLDLSFDEIPEAPLSQSCLGSSNVLVNAMPACW